MESWNQIIHTALLGTDKKNLKKEDVVPELAESFELIAQGTQNKEEAFLQTAALVYNYRQCGFLPTHKEVLPLPVAEGESKSYASDASHQVLTDIIELGSNSLLRFWLEQCAGKEKIILPEVIPLLMDAGIKNKQLQSLIYTCCGNRGKWLAQFNPEWQYNDEIDNNELWNTGTLEQRKAILRNIRTINPLKARELLQQIWNQENAAAKVELLQELSANANDEDLPWLESLLDEKSAKVKDAALHILKAIPLSSIVKQYWSVLEASIQVKISKGLLGIGANTALEIKLVNTDPSIYKTGIQQLSSQAHSTDEHFILYQLISAVPPHMWEGHLNLEKKGILKLFKKDEQHKTYIPAFGQAAVRFKDQEWLRAVIAADDKLMHLDALYLLPQKEAEYYALNFLDNEEKAADILQLIRFFKQEWSLEFASAVLKFTAKNPYQYNKAFYNQIIYVLPLAITVKVESYAPKEEHFGHMWSNLSAHLLKMLTLKQQTLTTFNA